MNTLDDQPPDARSLSARILRPDRPTLAAVRAATEGITDPSEAWEVLATRGLIPLGWLDGPQRTFEPRLPPEVSALGRVDRSCAAGEQVYVTLLDGWRRSAHRHVVRRTGCRCDMCLGSGPVPNVVRAFRAAEDLRRGDWVVACGRFDVCLMVSGAPSPTPSTLAAAITLASDVPGVTTAEAFAREGFSDASRPVRWDVLPHEELDAAREAAEAAVLDATTTRIEREVLALGYFVRGVSENDAALVLLAPQVPDQE